jgi:putative SOS response-associated peptidase YedK
MEAMRWGLIPAWYKRPNDGPLLINARAETLLQKPAFRDAVHSRRVLVVASGFYEWTKDAQDARDPWYITRSDGSPLALAAIWEGWHDPETGALLRSVALLTVAANAPMQAIHHRMPVVIAPPDQALWLGEQGKGAAPLMRASPDYALHWHRVSRAAGELVLRLLDAEVHDARYLVGYIAAGCQGAVGVGHAFDDHQCRFATVGHRLDGPAAVFRAHIQCPARLVDKGHLVAGLKIAGLGEKRVFHHQDAELLCRGGACCAGQRSGQNSPAQNEFSKHCSAPWCRPPPSQRFAIAMDYGRSEASGAFD